MAASPLKPKLEPRSSHVFQATVASQAPPVTHLVLNLPRAKLYPVGRAASAGSVGPSLMASVCWLVFTGCWAVPESTCCVWL